MCFSWSRCCRCLAIGAPDAEVKLALLSDIAQEHSVEWDSHRAHQEMITGDRILRLQTHVEEYIPRLPYGGLIGVLCIQ